MTNSIQLNNGLNVPILGFGTADIGNHKRTIEVIGKAIEVGFRRFDTAAFYGNEKAIGKAISNSGLPREEFIVTSKLWNSDFGQNRTRKAFEKSLSNLGFDYLDIYLLHWPVPGKRIQSWKVLEELYEERLIRAIGVSNFTIVHLQELLEHSGIVPAINQVEFNPFLYQKSLLDFCNVEQITLEAYSPFSKGKRLQDKNISKIAAKYNKSTAQVILRWCIQLGIMVIPKTSTEDRILANFNVFDFTISEDDMKLLSSLNEDYRIEWDPNFEN